MIIERLEERIAPAVLIVNTHTAKYTDVDGDKITIYINKGTLTGADFVSVSTGLGDQLQEINLTNPLFNGTNLTISALKSKTGDGLVNVGLINATGNDLGVVKIAGDLSSIEAGEPNSIGLNALHLRSFGVAGTNTLPSGDFPGGSITGKVDTVSINGNFDQEAFSAGGIGSLSIGGSVIGQITGDAGIFGGTIGSIKIGGTLAEEIYSTGDIGSITIGHDLAGTSYAPSGTIVCGGNLGKVSIGGSVLGGTSADTGEISVEGNITSITIKGDLIGGSNVRTGVINASGNINTINIGGSIIGGSGSASGQISTMGNLGTLKIGGDLLGGSAGANPADPHSVQSITQSGEIISSGEIDQIIIGGMIVSGSNDDGNTSVTESGTIRAGENIGCLTVNGGILGHPSTGSAGGVPVIISAVGQATPANSSDLAIGKISICGDVTYANILAGYNSQLTPINGSAQIGTVNVSGNWTASNLVAGCENTGYQPHGTANVNYGDLNDAPIPNSPTPGILATIQSVRISGQIYGSTTGDHFGFVADQIDAFSFSGIKEILQSGPGNDFIILPPANVCIHEV